MPHLRWYVWLHCFLDKCIFLFRVQCTHYISITECDGNTYGLECNQSCGNCSGGVQCDHVTGSCQNGCVAGMYGDRCDKGILRVN